MSGGGSSPETSFLSEEHPSEPSRSPTSKLSGRGNPELRAGCLWRPSHNLSLTYYHLGCALLSTNAYSRSISYHQIRQEAFYSKIYVTYTCLLRCPRPSFPPCSNWLVPHLTVTPLVLLSLQAIEVGWG